MNVSKPDQLGFNEARLNRINDITTSYVDSGRLAGTITLVARHKQIAHMKCYGKMSLETGEEIRPDSLFRIYSMTKPIVSVAIMILYERGHFLLDTPVSKFIPSFANPQVFVSGSAINFTTQKAEREITIIDLLKHTSGLTYDFLNVSVVDEMYRNSGLRGDKNDIKGSDMMRIISSMPLLFSPGKKWNYSVSTDVLGYLIEVITGKPLDQFLKKEIFEPLGMIDTDFYVPSTKQNRFTTSYMIKSAATPEKQALFPNDKIIPMDDPFIGRFSVPPLFQFGGGGLVSTVEDYLKFSTMLLDKGQYNGHCIVSPKSIELMTMNHLAGDLLSCCSNNIVGLTNPGIGFGLGFGITSNIADASTIGNVGSFWWGGAANTYFFVDPKESLIGILMTQCFPSIVNPIRREFTTAIYQSLLD